MPATVSSIRRSDTQPSEAEKKARIDCAAAHRLSEEFGWTQLIYNHISQRVPDDPSSFLIKPHGLMFNEICASNLAKISYEGGPTHDELGVNSSGYAIHSAILKARPDVNAAVHIHTFNTRSKMPENARRLNRLNTLLHLPKRAGRSRHGDPVRIRQSTSSRKWRLSAAVTPGSVALPSNMGSTSAHMASVSTVLSGFICHSARLACAAVLAVVEAMVASIRTNRNPIVNGRLIY